MSDWWQNFFTMFVSIAVVLVVVITSIALIGALLQFCFFAGVIVIVLGIIASISTAHANSLKEKDD